MIRLTIPEFAPTEAEKLPRQSLLDEDGLASFRT
jgi:hypothetical protein